MTIAVEASKHKQAKAQLLGLLSAVMVEAPMRSMSGAELRLYNVEGAPCIADLQTLELKTRWFVCLLKK